MPRAPKAEGGAVAVRSKNTNIVSIQEALKKQAEGIGDRVGAASGIKIKATQDKHFILPDGTKCDTLDVVILDFVATSNYYASEFDREDITPPDCFAVGIDPKKLVPSANVPNKQADSCSTCPMNEFGSRGKGKACKNGRLLAVLPPDAGPDTPIWLLQPSATALKGFDAYVTSVARTFQMPPISVVTTVSFDENSEYSKMVFGNPQPNKLLADMFARQAEATQLLNAERDVSGWKPMEQPKARAGGRNTRPVK